jgi:hypothetical protein
MSSVVLDGLELYGLTFEQLQHAVRENVQRSVRLKRDRELWNLRLEISGKSFEVGHTKEEDGWVHVIGIREAK